MLKIMLNFLVVVIVIAIPISANIFDSSSTKVQTEINWDFKILCANASDIDLERNYRLYQEYEKCVNDKVNSNQLSEDIETVLNTLSSSISSNSQVTNEKNSIVFTTVKKYCPNANEIMKCEDILSPIVSDCFTDEHRKSIALVQRIKRIALDFFCQEDAKQAETFIKEKFLHCLHAYKYELDNCLSQFVPFPKSIGRDKVTYATENDFCKSFEELGKCFIPKMEQCELSQNIGTHLKSFNTYIQTNVCTSSTNPSSR